MADTKITQLPLATSVTGDDLLVVVADPAGTPVTKAITINNALAGVAGPTGATGPVGATGATGPAGEDSAILSATSGTGSVVALPTQNSNVIDTANNSSILAGANNQVALQSNAHVIGSNIVADASNTTFVNNLKLFGVYDASLNEGAGGYVQGHVTLRNNTQISVGSFDNMTGGANGLSLHCAVGYELNWQGGHLRNVVTGDSTGTPQQIYVDSPLEFPSGGPTAANMSIDATGLTFTDGTTQTTASLFTTGGGGPGSIVPAGAFNNAANYTYSTVSGGSYNVCNANWGTISGGQSNNASTSHSTVSGGWSNTASGSFSTVGGGVGNTASASHSTVSGGANNTASGNSSTVSGGFSNNASGNYSTVGGGRSNTASGNYSTVGGGANNTASGGRSTVSGGGSNNASGNYSTVGGGRSNTASNYGTISGGKQAVADRYGMAAYATGQFAAAGDAQRVNFVLRNATTDATPTSLYLNGTDARLTIPSGKMLAATVTIAGIISGGSKASHYTRKVAIKNVGGTTTLVGSVSTVGTDVEDDADYAVTITADDTNDALDISVTGKASENIRWVAHVEGVEIAYG